MIYAKKMMSRDRIRVKVAGKTQGFSWNIRQSDKKRRLEGTWSDSKVEELLKFVMEYKSKCEFKSVDFEADLQSLYTEVRRCMANLYPDDFGAPSLTETEMSIKETDKVEYKSFKSRNDVGNLVGHQI